MEGWLGDLGLAVAGAVSRDVTDELAATTRLLVLAPHPDDETLACGACIARLSGSEWAPTLAVATDGASGRHDVPQSELARIRRTELAAAVSELGIDPGHVIWMGFDDGQLGSEMDRLAERVGDLLASVRPNVVLSPWAHDTHPDHAALGRAARMATAGSGVAVLEYVVWAWTDPLHLLLDAARHRRSGTGRVRGGGGPGRFVPGRPVRVRAGGYLGTKVSALGAHRSQLGPSASDLGLPAGDGPLGPAFLRHFTGPFELFFPVTSRRRSPGHPGSS